MRERGFTQNSKQRLLRRGDNQMGVVRRFLRRE